LGSTGFRHIEVEVGPGVFIPRPETELVTEAAIRELAVQPVGERIAVDLCSGSGAIAISLGLEVEGSRIHAVELSDDAIGWTRRNVDAYQARLSAVGSGVDVVHDDVAVVADQGHSLSRLAGRVAVVIANPPYIPDHMIPREPEVRDHEPSMALYGGDDGLDVVRALLRTAAVLMRPDGLLVIEHADVQGMAAGARGVPGVVSAMTVDPLLSGLVNLPLGAKVFRSVTDRIDLNGLPRFTLARRVPA
jgi:release factor glutamine methyltransferase